MVTMKHQLRISALPAFRGGWLPFRSGFEEISDQLLRDIDLVDMEVPGGMLTLDRKQFTPIQEANYQADQHIKRGDWPSAVKALNRMIELRPDPPLLSAVYIMLGMAHAQARNQDAAVVAFREAIRINENAEYAHLFLGTALMLSDRSEEAIDPIKKALELDSSLTHANFYLGHVYSSLGRWDEAIASYGAEIESHPKSPEAYQELARLFVRLGDENVAEREQYYLNAIETFRKWIEITPEDANTHNLIGYLCMMVGRPDPAIAAFERAIRIDSNHILALYNVGTAYLDTDRNLDAKEIFERITQLGEDFIRAQLARLSPNVEATIPLSMCEAYQKLGAAALKIYQTDPSKGRELLSEAETAFKASLRYIPDDIHSLYNLGITHYMMSCRAAAIKELRQVLEIQPNHEDAANNLRVIEEELTKVRHWLGSKVWKRLESSTDQAPVFSEDLVDEIAHAREKIYENVAVSHERDAFTADDLLQALRPLMEYIPSAETIADLTVGIFRRGWLSSSQAACLAGTDLAAFLAYSYLVGVSLDELASEIGDQGREYADALVDALKEVVELQPDDERASAQLQTLLQERLDQKLQESGLVKEVRGPITDFTPYKDRTLMPVGNKPLSEIVVEDRR
jgi:tetratricopeptide (TPR) repeat protein